MLNEYIFINKEYCYDSIVENIQEEAIEIINTKFDFDFCKPIVEVNIMFINSSDEWELTLTLTHNNETVSKVIYSTSLEYKEFNLEKDIADLYNDTLF